MKKKGLRRAFTVLLCVAFVSGAVAMGYRALQYQEGEAAYAEAEDLVELPDLTHLQEPAPQKPAEQKRPSLQEEPVSSEESALPQEPAPETEQKPVYVDPYADELASMDFAALREVNDEVLGWILIPWTRVSYPLLQAEDNDYYLNHTWRNTRSSVGSIFVEWRNQSDLSDFNTIIYGHRMNNGSMFASLKNYKQQSYWEEHPKVYIMDDYGMHTYEIFAAYEAGVDQDTYRLLFADDTEKQAFLDFCVSQSAVETGVVPTVEDRILTLSTCTGRGYDTRWVVQAVLR